MESDLNAVNEAAIESAADSYIEGLGIDFDLLDGTLDDLDMARDGFIAGWEACCRVTSWFLISTRK